MVHVLKLHGNNINRQTTNQEKSIMEIFALFQSIGRFESVSKLIQKHTLDIFNAHIKPHFTKQHPGMNDTAFTDQHQFIHPNAMSNAVNDKIDFFETQPWKTVPGVIDLFIGIVSLIKVKLRLF